LGLEYEGALSWCLIVSLYFNGIPKKTTWEAAACVATTGQDKTLAIEE
jgi:hypothetical protein